MLKHILAVFGSMDTLNIPKNVQKGQRCIEMCESNEGCGEKHLEVTGDDTKIGSKLPCKGTKLCQNAKMVVFFHKY